MIAATWALTVALLILAVVIAVVGWYWATASQLDRRLTSAEAQMDAIDFNWPVLDSEPDGLP